MSLKEFAETGTTMKEVAFCPGMMFSVVVEVAGKLEVESGTLRVDEHGGADLPLIGQVKLAGLTQDGAVDYLTKLYLPYYRENPRIRVQLYSDKNAGVSPWGYITVLGRISKPGRIELSSTRSMSLLDAIQRANGFASSANLHAVRVTRTGKDGKKVQVIINMNTIGTSNESNQDIRLRAGDVVFVPEQVF